MFMYAVHGWIVVACVRKPEYTVACMDREQGRSGSDNAGGLLRLYQIPFTVDLLSSNMRTYLIYTGLVMSLNAIYSGCFSLTFGPNVMYTRVRKLSSNTYDATFVCFYCGLTWINSLCVVQVTVRLNHYLCLRYSHKRISGWKKG
jgi:hypothetical protein